MKYGKGNIREQRKRRRKRLKNLPQKQPEMVALIDGNYSYYPYAFCKSKQAYLTLGLVNTHKCEKKHCGSLRRCGGAE